MDIRSFFVNDCIKIVVKPNAPKTEVVGQDENKKALRVAVNAVPDKDKANNKLVKFISKQIGENVEIISGSKSREKLIKIKE